jgi:hypothetical protein
LVFRERATSSKGLSRCGSSAALSFARGGMDLARVQLPAVYLATLACHLLSASIIRDTLRSEADNVHLTSPSPHAPSQLRNVPRSTRTLMLCLRYVQMPVQRRPHQPSVKPSPDLVQPTSMASKPCDLSLPLCALNLRISPLFCLTMDEESLRSVINCPPISNALRHIDEENAIPLAQGASRKSVRAPHFHRARSLSWAALDLE